VTAFSQYCWPMKPTMGVRTAIGRIGRRAVAVASRSTTGSRYRWWSREAARLLSLGPRAPDGSRHAGARLRAVARLQPLALPEARLNQLGRRAWTLHSSTQGSIGVVELAQPERRGVYRSADRGASVARGCILRSVHSRDGLAVAEQELAASGLRRPPRMRVDAGVARGGDHGAPARWGAERASIESALAPGITR